MKPQKHPSGAEARVHLVLFSARLKSCPFKEGSRNRVFPQARKSCKVKAQGWSPGARA